MGMQWEGKARPLPLSQIRKKRRKYLYKVFWLSL
jgi:hypothetical protein